MPNPEKSPHFFERESDGSVRLRLRFPEDVADDIEVAAGRTPLVTWIQDVIATTAKEGADAARQDRPRVRPT